MCRFASAIAIFVFTAAAAQSQTTVDASQRQAKASDFTPVTLPALDPSLLQSTVSATRPASAKPNIQLQYDPTPEFVYPHDPNLTRWVTVKNNGSYVELEFRGSVNGPGGFSTPGTLHPQGYQLCLQPGESQRIWMIADWTELNRSSWRAGGVYDYRVDIQVYTPGEGPTGPDARTASLHNNVHVAYLTPPFTTGGPVGDNNAAISGTLTDALTGKPLANVPVQVVSSTDTPFTPVTDSSGHYSVPVTAYRRAMQGTWNDFGVSIRASGYAGFHTAVAPHPGDTVRVDAALVPAVQGPAFTIHAKANETLNQYRGDASADGKYMAVAPFHTGGSSNPADFELSFFSTDGAPLWQFPLNAEMPAVSVSGDGSLIATARQAGADNAIYLLDNAGHVAWSSDLGFTAATYLEVRISHGKKYLAAGDVGGHLYLIDLASKKTVWQRFLHNQIRTLAFETDDGTLYADSGDGYFYCFRIDGTLVWRTYVGGWSTSFDMSKNYILVGGKEEYFISLLNKTNGQTVWQFPVVVSPNYAFIAPDESYIAAVGSAGGFGTLLLDMNGVLLDHDAGANAVAIGGGGSYLLLGSTDPDLKTSLWVIGRDGRELWNSGPLGTATQAARDGYAWISDDSRNMAFAVANWVYFLALQGPSVTSAGVVSAASYSGSATYGISPGELVTLFGKGMGPAQLTTLQLDSAGRVSTLLAGTQVLFDSTSAPILYTSSGQASVIAPYDLAGKSRVTVTVQYQGLSSPPMELPVVSANPALFTLDSSGKGDAAIVHADGTPVNAASPAAAGETVILYADGYGVSTPALPDGTIVASTLPKPVGDTVLLIDGQPVDTLYCGSAPSEVNGVLQINFRVPALVAGAHQIQLRVGDRKSPAGVLMRIR